MLATDAWTIVRCSASMKKAAYKVHICNPSTVEAEAEDSRALMASQSSENEITRFRKKFCLQNKSREEYKSSWLLASTFTCTHIYTHTTPHHTTLYYNTIQHNKITLHQAIIFAPHGGSVTEAKLYWHCWRKQKCLERRAHIYGDIHSYILFVLEILPSIPCCLLIRISIQKDQQK